MATQIFASLFFVLLSILPLRYGVGVVVMSQMASANQGKYLLLGAVLTIIGTLLLLGGLGNIGYVVISWIKS